MTTRPTRRSGLSAPARRLGIVMLTPAMGLLGLLILVPLGYAAYLSLHTWQLTDINGSKPFSGLHSYDRILHDPLVRTALRNTVVYVVGAVSVELILGFVIATALFEMTKGRQLANSLILLPMIVAPVVTALLWRYMLDPQFGVLSQLLAVFGDHHGIDWFGSEKRALPGLMLVDIWQWTPFVVLVLHAGMLSIPEERFEAATVDGAGHLRLLRSIVLPSVAPQILLVLLFRTMDTYRIFDTVFVITKGGPVHATETIGLYTYRTGFSYFDMGYAMALSIFILVTVAAISAIYIRLLRRRDVF
ncbi:MAG: multiple sugar transport system permease protein [Actinomycetota bacterium]|jgi:multiple sugar transport system permease protein|nr:multiple sugar transport system permease protein [Actinomycetota bacterium]